MRHLKGLEVLSETHSYVEALICPVVTSPSQLC